MNSPLCLPPPWPTPLDYTFSSAYESTRQRDSTTSSLLSRMEAIRVASASVLPWGERGDSSEVGKRPAIRSLVLSSYPFREHAANSLLNAAKAPFQILAESESPAPEADPESVQVGLGEFRLLGRAQSKEGRGE